MTVGLVSFAVTALTLVGLVPLLRRMHLLDVPNRRSSHRVPTPRGGGLAVLVGIAAAVLVGAPLQPFWYGVLGVVAVLGAVGLVDDLRGLGTGVRLAAHVVGGGAAGWLLTSGAGVGGAWLPAAVVVCALWVVAFVNAFNFMDGVNGISGVTGAVTGAWYGWLGYSSGDPALLLLGVALAGACVGFLPFNAVRARVFLGDVGSYGIGALIAVLAVWVAAGHGGFVAAVAPVAVYAADTGWTLLRRWHAGASLTTAHREHVYQRLTDRGFTHEAVAASVGALTAACCLVAAVLPDVLAIAVGAILVIGYLTSPSWTPVARHREAHCASA